MSRENRKKIAYENFEKSYEYQKRSEWQEALKWIDKAIKISPEVDFFLARINIFHEMNVDNIVILRDYDSAIRTFDNKKLENISKKKNELLVKMLREYASIASESNFLEISRDAHKRVIKILGPKNVDCAEDYLELGYVLYQMHNYNDAVEAYTHSILLDPNSKTSSAHFRRGDSLYCLKKYHLAIKDYNISIENNPISEHFRLRGMCWMDLCIFHKALADFNSAIERKKQEIKKKNGNSKDEQIQISDLITIKGDCYCRKGDHKQAIKEYTKAINMKNNVDDYYYNRGDCYYDLGEYNNAIKDFQKAIELNKGNDDMFFRKHITNAYIMLNDKKNARRCLENEMNSEFHIGDEESIEIRKVMLNIWDKKYEINIFDIMLNYFKSTAISSNLKRDFCIANKTFLIKNDISTVILIFSILISCVERACKGIGSIKEVRNAFELFYEYKNLTKIKNFDQKTERDEFDFSIFPMSIAHNVMCEELEILPEKIQYLSRISSEGEKLYDDMRDKYNEFHDILLKCIPHFDFHFKMNKLKTRLKLQEKIKSNTRYLNIKNITNDDDNDDDDEMDIDENDFVSNSRKRKREDFEDADDIDNYEKIKQDSKRKKRKIGKKN